MGAPAGMVDPPHPPTSTVHPATPRDSAPKIRVATVAGARHGAPAGKEPHITHRIPPFTKWITQSRSRT
jgi:hypothetical protein